MFLREPPSIPLEVIQWQEVGGDEVPACRLLAHIRIAGLDMHLEAWEIERDAEGLAGMVNVKPETGRQDDFDTLCLMFGCAFDTTNINGREYVLLATPYGR